ncbi:flagellar motor switch protein FliG [Thioclava sp. SK-1]|uniref:flagellar motor switch protein FliG n=1 Tax=Thioclava sp. SK-1 TaxID=1889770 RepID=UPI0009F1E649|nr:FliG C-terminal domain-containing protein [Thioclava sp. SK-1]
MNQIAPLAPLGQLAGFGDDHLAGPPGLTKKQKAAIIVRLLSAEGEKLPLTELSDDQQTDLAEEIAKLRIIDRATLEQVVEEFCNELETIGIAVPGGLDSVLKLLEGQLTPSAETRLRKLAAGSSRSDPWERISGLGTDAMLPLIENESIEVCAVLLSKLTVAKSAELLSQMPGDKARRVAYAVSQTGAVAPQTVWRIGQAIASQLDAVPARAFTSGPVERVGAILNYTTASRRDDVLEGLDEADKVFADEVRKAIFTFANIPVRIDKKDLPKILRAVDQPKLLVALAGSTGANEKSKEFILSNISQRMADGMREEIAEMGKVKEKDVEEAMSEVVSAIRKLEEAGEIFLVAEDED